MANGASWKQVTLGNYLTIAAMVASLITAGYGVNAKIDRVSLLESAHFTQVVERIQDHSERITALEERMTAVEVQMASHSRHLESIDENIALIRDVVVNR